MTNKIPRVVYLDYETDEDLGSLAYNLQINKIEVIKKLITEGLRLGILEDYFKTPKD